VKGEAGRGTPVDGSSVPRNPQGSSSTIIAVLRMEVIAIVEATHFQFRYDDKPSGINHFFIFFQG